MGIGHGHLPAPSLGVFLPLVRVRAGTARGTSDLCPVWTSNSALTIHGTTCPCTAKRSRLLPASSVTKVADLVMQFSV
jgi:hypothetical protein